MADVSLKNIQGVFTPDDIKKLDKISNDAENNAKIKSQAMDQDAFMKILATQLKYQDPLSPMKDQEFIGQMAQFNSLNAMNSLVDLTKENSVVSEDMVTIMAMMSVGIDKLVDHLIPKEETDTETDTDDSGDDTTTTTPPVDGNTDEEALAMLSSDTLEKITKLAKNMKSTNEAFKAYADA